MDSAGKADIVMVLDREESPIIPALKQVSRSCDISIVPWDADNVSGPSVFLLYHSAQQFQICAGALADAGILGNKTVACFSGGQTVRLARWPAEVAVGPEIVRVDLPCLRQDDVPVCLQLLCWLHPLTEAEFRSAIDALGDEFALEALSALWALGGLSAVLTPGDSPAPDERGQDVLKVIEASALPDFERWVCEFVALREDGGRSQPRVGDCGGWEGALSLLGDLIPTVDWADDPHPAYRTLQALRYVGSACDYGEWARRLALLRDRWLGEAALAQTGARQS